MVCIQSRYFLSDKCFSIFEFDILQCWISSQLSDLTAQKHFCRNLIYQPQIQLMCKDLNILVNPWSSSRLLLNPLHSQCIAASHQDIQLRVTTPTEKSWKWCDTTDTNHSVKLQCFWSLTSSSLPGLKRLEPLMRLDSSLPIYPWINSTLHSWAIHLPILWPNSGVICALINIQL